MYKSRTAIDLSIRGQRDASEKTLQKMSQSTKNPQIRAKARLEMLKRKTQTEKISILFEMLVKKIIPDQFDLIMNDKTAPFTSTYFQVIKLFSSIMAEMNPNDSDKFFVLKALASKYSFENIRAISPVI